MTIHLATFSSHRMTQARALCISSALKHGVDSIAGPHYFDPGIEYRDGFTLEWMMCQTLVEKMPADWWSKRGCGYWLWKPFLINRVMNKVPDGDLIIYADAGIEFIGDVNHIVSRMDQDVWLFGNNWEHAHWCKADVVREVWPDVLVGGRRVAVRPPTELEIHDANQAFWTYFGKQVQASVILFRVSDYSRKFVKEWLDWCLFEGGRLIDDSPSRLPSHPEFQEHRHDQAILTTLAYREGIKPHWWPAVYNRGGSPEFVYEKLPEYAGDDYPVLVSHHRRRDLEWA